MPILMMAGHNTHLNLSPAGDPKISSLFPHFPVTSPSPSVYTVPLGYAGTIVNCAAYGWPTPTIEWFRGSQSLPSSEEGGRVFFDAVQREGSAYVSARLRSGEDFEETDAGTYSCVVRANDTGIITSKDVILEYTSAAPPTQVTPTPTCSVDSREVLFELRMLDTDCDFWSEDLKQLIARDFMEEIVNAVGAECPECEVGLADLSLLSGPACSDQVIRAAVFRGMVSTDDRGRTEEIFCALSRWQGTRPLVLINNNFRVVDGNCSLELDSLESGECRGGGGALGSIGLPVVVGAAAGGAVVLVGVAVAVLCCCCVCGKHKRKNKELGLGNRNSNYDR